MASWKVLDKVDVSTPLLSAGSLSNVRVTSFEEPHLWLNVVYCVEGERSWVPCKRMVEDAPPDRLSSLEGSLLSWSTPTPRWHLV